MNETRPDAQSQPKSSFCVNVSVLSLAYCCAAFVRSSLASANICRRVNIKYTIMFMTTQSILHKLNCQSTSAATLFFVDELLFKQLLS